MKYLENIEALYILPKDPLIDDVLIPAFKSATGVDCMVGYFASSVLADIAPGLATFIIESKGKFRLVMSPYLQLEDIVAIEEGTKSRTEIATTIFDDLIMTEDLIERHTLKCLSYLLKINRLEIKIAFMKDALFHPKVWLFRSGEDTLAVHGSGNVTRSGVRKNKEQIAICKSWDHTAQTYSVNKLTSEFDKLWQNKEDDCIVIPAPRAVEENLLMAYEHNSVPTEEEFLALYNRATQHPANHSDLNELDPPDYNIDVFSIPTTLCIDDGDFAHQGKAVRAWCDAGFQGILEMATGSGKTITSMVAAYRLYEVEQPLLVVVSAPYTPLVQQWCDEISIFGVYPTNMTTLGGARARGTKLEQIKRRLHTALSTIEIIVVSHDTLVTDEFKKVLDTFTCKRLLIADEVHNLGSEGFITKPPDFFEFRLGLSATPERQYDTEGTQALYKYFGDPVFQFTMDEAIGHCLVEYDYFTHAVPLTADEMEEWRELTEKIGRNHWREEAGKPDAVLSSLLRKRRELLETAEGKIDALKKLLEQEDLTDLKHTLIYTSDKQPKQLTKVNELLNEKRVRFHQLTSEETSNRTQTNDIIRGFQDGELQVLTAKRVLDEGVNIPQICKAFILASTTVERQWIQRRGRLLRKCNDIGKVYSEIHDFVTLPPDTGQLSDKHFRKLAQSELKRVSEFSRLARNAGAKGASLDMVDYLTKQAYS